MTIRKFIQQLSTVTVAAGCVFALNACSDTTLMEPDLGNNSGVATLTTTQGVTSSALAKVHRSDKTYPQSGSVTLKPKRRGYARGHITLGQGSKLTIRKRALTPPAGMEGQPVTITMLAERVGDELQFTFGPHGSKFDPPVAVRLDWSDLGVDKAALYYINENGEYELQEPDHINFRGKFMILYLDHFSRYRVAWAH